MIEIKNITKTFQDVVAVDNITLTIKEGVVMGLLGTNGAGKSTLLRMISGILKQDSGEIIIDNESVWNNPKAKDKFFYIFRIDFRIVWITVCNFSNNCFGAFGFCSKSI